MAKYSLRVPADFEVPALVSVTGVLVVAAATKGGYPLWVIGGMTFLYVLYVAVYGVRTCHEFRSMSDPRAVPAVPASHIAETKGTPP